MKNLFEIVEKLSNSTVSYGYSLFKPYLVKKTAQKFDTEDTIYKNVSWKPNPEFKPGST